MRKNSRVSPKGFLVFLLSGLLIPGVPGLFAQQGDERDFPSPEGTRWFRSNAAGMTLEAIPSRAAALRNKYALSVENADPGGLPPLLKPLLGPGLRAELRILFEEGEPLRRQWIFRDRYHTTRLAASGGEGVFGDAPPAAEDEQEDEPAEDGEEDGDDGEKAGPTGFIETYDERGLITEERFIAGDGTESAIFYYYKGDVLIRAEIMEKPRPVVETAEEAAAETGEEAPAETGSPREISPDGLAPVATDYYRYSRSGSIRAIDRVIHGAGTENGRPVRLSLPRLRPDFGETMEDLVNPGIAYTPEFLQDVIDAEEVRIIYATDSRGRILSETRLDGEDRVIGRITNTWSGDRLASVRLESGDVDRLTEYGYDGEGNRIMESNFNHGVLERRVRREGEQDLEELYMDGRVILRAVWEQGRKISEERVR
jgi:hypothetical protein